MVGHARHLDRFSAGRAAPGKGNVEQPSGFFRIIEKQFVEIPHAIKHQHLGMLRLDAQVLLHHGGVCSIHDFIFAYKEEKLSFRDWLNLGAR